jgi:hypothetical protein
MEVALREKDEDLKGLKEKLGFLQLRNKERAFDRESDKENINSGQLNALPLLGGKEVSINESPS